MSTCAFLTQTPRHYEVLKSQRLFWVYQATISRWVSVCESNAAATTEVVIFRKTVHHAPGDLAMLTDMFFKYEENQAS